MYQNKIVACIKVGGRILREDGGIVILPFGSEYSLLVKNLNSVRAKINVTIDATDATEGCCLVVGPHATLELERFIKNSNMESGNRFKFIERTEQIEEHRGINAEDGLIQIAYQIERVSPNFPRYPEYRRPSPSQKSGLSLRNMRATASSRVPSRKMRADVCLDSAKISLDTGITVPGSRSDQRFQWTSGFDTYPKEVLVLQLRGQIGEKFVTQPVTVEHKPQCVTCGRVNKANARFCSNCGTALEII
jgi:hypothetical protein